jgi:hypothetical protein
MHAAHAFDFAPRHRSAATGNASLLGRVLHAVALGAGLDNQAPLIARIPKGLVHFVGDRGRFRHGLHLSHGGKRIIYLPVRFALFDESPRAFDGIRSTNGDAHAFPFH